MKKQEDKRLTIFRIFFQTVPVLLMFGIIIAFEGYDLYPVLRDCAHLSLI